LNKFLKSVEVRPQQFNKLADTHTQKLTRDLSEFFLFYVKIRRRVKIRRIIFLTLSRQNKNFYKKSAVLNTFTL